MRRHAIIGALLLVGLGVILGATVFRADIAQATGLAQSVTVNNTAAEAVPVREQNLDGGNVKVHEEGTANVRVTNSPLQVQAVGDPVTIFLSQTIAGSNISYTVPAGKRLLIKYINGGSSSDQIRLRIAPATLGTTYFFRGEGGSCAAPDCATYVFSDEVSIETPPGVLVEMTSPSGGAFGMTLNGYLVDS